MQLEVVGLDGLDMFDFSSVIKAVGTVAQKAAPDLLQAAVNKKLAKLQGKPAPVVGPSDVIDQAKNDFRKMTQPQTPAPTRQQAQAPVVRREQVSDQGSDKTLLWVVGGLSVVGLILLLRG